MCGIVLLKSCFLGLGPDTYQACKDLLIRIRFTAQSERCVRVGRLRGAAGSAAGASGLRTPAQ